MNGDRPQNQSFPGQPSRTPVGSGPYVTQQDNDSPPGFYYPPPPMMAQQQQQPPPPPPPQQRGMQDHQQAPPPSPLQGGPQSSQQPIAQVPTPTQLFQFSARSHMHSAVSSPALARALSTLSQDKNRRPRSEKKPIPDEQKDDKYFERRRRNNEAAKKSRDARKTREDELAIRASFLEKDNSVLKVQVMSMREEAMKLRQMWFQKCQSGGLNGNGRAMGPGPQGGRNS